MREKFLLLFLLGFPLFTSCNLFAQENPDIVSDILNQVENEQVNRADWLEYLWELKEHPLDINRANTLDLMRIPFLPPEVAREIVRYRRKHGKFQQIQDLLHVPGMNQEILSALEPFIRIQSPPKPEFLFLRTHFYYNSPLRKGYRQGVYVSPLYFKQRVLFQSPLGFSFNLLMEKDAGEARWNDFTSLAFTYTTGRNFRILLGDYQLRFGSGLVLWSPFGVPLNTSSILPLPETRGAFLENRSTSVNGFLRGILLHRAISEHVSLTAFYSTRFLDASRDSSGQHIIRMQNYGYHRTDREIGYRNQLRETIVGLTPTYFTSQFSARLYFVGTQYVPRFVHQPSRLEHLGVSLRKDWQYFRIAAEMAMDQRQRMSIQPYFVYQDDRLRYLATFFYYHPHFFAPRSRAPGSFSTPAMNLIGFVSQTIFRVNRQLLLAGYINLYREITGEPDDLFLRRNYSVETQIRFGKHRLLLQWWQRYRMNDLPFSSELDKRITAARMGAQFKVNRNFSFRIRMELRWSVPMKPVYRYYATNFYFQGTYSPRPQWGFKFRWSAFDVPDYDVRIYENEPDMPGSIQSVLLNGYGYKWFMLAQIKLSSHFQLYFKYLHRNYPHRSSIGSGWDEISANYEDQFRTVLVVRM